MPERSQHSTQQKLLDLFPPPGLFLAKFRSVGSTKLRLNSEGASALAGAIGGAEAPYIPTPSFQWLFFDTIDGASPAGAQTFSFESPPIPFIGAITEVDVISTEPGADWQMRLSVPGQGPIFHTTQPTDILTADGWFRPTPPGFWPETEGIVFPLPVSGSKVLLEFARTQASGLNLTVRVLIVAHPSNG